MIEFMTVENLRRIALVLNHLNSNSTIREKDANAVMNMVDTWIITLEKAGKKETVRISELLGAGNSYCKCEADKAPEEEKGEYRKRTVFSGCSCAPKKFFFRCQQYYEHMALHKTDKGEVK